MPERLKAVSRMTEHAIGGPIVWNGAIGEPREGQMRAVTASFVAREPIEITSRVWDRTAAEADAIYAMIVESIDWNRIIISAMGFHLDRCGRDEVHRGTADLDAICGECIHDALLSKER